LINDENRESQTQQSKGTWFGNDLGGACGGDDAKLIDHGLRRDIETHRSSIPRENNRRVGRLQINSSKIQCGWVRSRGKAKQTIRVVEQVAPEDDAKDVGAKRDGAHEIRTGCNGIRVEEIAIHGGARGDDGLVGGKSPNFR
jgi:hypothetical protein